MKLFSFLFLILLVLEEFNCAPFSYWSDDVQDWRRGFVPDCGFGGSHYHGRYFRPWEWESHARYPSDFASITNEDQLSKETVDKPPNKILEKSIDIATKSIDVSSKTLDEPSRNALYKPSTKHESSSEILSDSSTVRPLDDIPAENLFDDYDDSDDPFDNAIDL